LNMKSKVILQGVGWYFAASIILYLTVVVCVEVGEAVNVYRGMTLLSVPLDNPADYEFESFSTGILVITVLGSLVTVIAIQLKRLFGE